jgi:hypothetical protein
MEKMNEGSRKSGGFSSADSIPGGGKNSPHNTDCLGSGKGGSCGTGDGAGKKYPDIK